MKKSEDFAGYIKAFLSTKDYNTVTENPELLQSVVEIVTEQEVEAQIDILANTEDDISDLYNEKLRKILNIGSIIDDFNNHVQRSIDLAKLRYEVLLQQEALRSSCEPKDVKTWKKIKFRRQIEALSHQEISELKKSILEKFKQVIFEFDLESINEDFDSIEEKLKQSLEYFKKISYREDISEELRNKAIRIIKAITDEDEQTQKNEENNSLYATLDEHYDTLNTTVQGIFRKYRIYYPIPKSRSLQEQSKTLLKELNEEESNFKQNLKNELLKLKVSPLREAPREKLHFSKEQESEAQLPIVYRLNLISHGENKLIGVKEIIDIEPDTNVCLRAQDVVFIHAHGPETKSNGTNKRSVIKHKISGEGRIILVNCFCPEDIAESIKLQTLRKKGKKIQLSKVLFCSNYEVHQEGVTKKYEHSNINKNDSVFELFGIKFQITNSKAPKKKLKGIVKAGKNPKLKEKAIAKAAWRKFNNLKTKNQWTAYDHQTEIKFPLKKTDMKHFMPQFIESKHLRICRAKRLSNLTVMSKKPSKYYIR